MLSHPQLQPRRITPKILQRVKRPLLLVEDMHHHIRVIDHDPLAHRVPVHGARRHLVILLQPDFDFGRDCLQMRLGCPAADHEKIREARDAAQIDGYNVFGFPIGGQLRAAGSQFGSS